MAEKQDRFAKLTPAQRELLLKRLKNQSSASQNRIQIRKNKNDYPLSSAQLRLWFLNQLDPESAFYNVPSALRLQGALDIDVLRQSIIGVLDRHQILRAGFRTNTKGEPEQFLASDSALDIPIIDLQDRAEDIRESPCRRVPCAGCF